MKKFLLAIALALATCLTPTAQAIDLGRVDMDSFASFLNRGMTSGISRYELGSQLIVDTQRSVRCTYDFTNVGGAISAINLKSSTTDALLKPATNCTLPKGAIVWEAFVDTVTTPTSGGSATIALSTGQTAADLLAATAIASYTGILAAIPVGTAAAAIKLTADRVPTATVATAALTAGKFYVIINYNLSQTL